MNRPLHLALAAALAAVAAIGLGFAPALAQADTAPITDTAAMTDTAVVTDPTEGAITALSEGVWLVDGRTAELPALMPAEDVAKIAALQAVPIGTGYKIQSPVSPDDQVVLVGAGSTRNFFLNLRDGSTVDVNVPRLSASTNYVWLDDNTLGFLTTDMINQQATVVGATLDRRTGEMSYGDDRLDAIATLTRKGELVVLITPNLRRVLLLDNTNAKPNPLFAPSETGFGDGASGWDIMPPNAKFLLSEGTTLRVVDLESGASHAITTLGPNIEVLDVAFSPDGSKFSVTTAWVEQNRTNDLSGGPRLFDVTYQDVLGILPPEENPYFTENVLTVLDVESGEVREMRAVDGDGSFYTTASWSDDGQTLMVKVNQPGLAAGREFPQYYREFQAGAGFRFYDAQLNEIQRLDRPEIDSVELRAQFVSNDEIIIETRYITDGQPYSYNLTTGEFRKIAERPGVYYAVTPTNSTREIVYVYSSYADAPEFFRLGWDGTGEAQLTTLNADVANFSNVAQYPVSFTVRSGATFAGVLVLPGDVAFPPQNIPIVVWQRGGPSGAMSSSWQATVESPQALLPNFGFGVLVVPIYGRYGVGPENFLALADNDNFGQADIAVQAEIADQLRERGWASKVGISGCSYGGYFTVQSIASYPETYDAAHTMCSIVDLLVEWNIGDGILAPYLMGIAPWDDMDEFMRDSPIYQALEIRTPLLAFHGTQDFLPVDTMLNLMLRVIGNDQPAKLLIFQGAYHNFASTPATLKDPYELYSSQELILWFREHLME